MKYTTAFETILARTLDLEGGYSNHASDSGGATRYGITAAVARRHGYRGDMRDLPLPVAKSIYWQAYWLEVQGDHLHAVGPQLTEEIFDTAVNQGKHQAATYLQRALNVFNRQGTIYADLKVDGWIGPKTIYAFIQFMRSEGEATSPEDAEDLLLKAVEAMQGDYYISLCERRQKDEAFVRGWFRHRIGNTNVMREAA